MNLSIAIDGVIDDDLVFPLIDGDDRFNAAAERSAIDHAYEIKTASPDSIVAILVDVDEEEVAEPKTLTVTFDVSGWTPEEIADLSGDVQAQGDGKGTLRDRDASVVGVVLGEQGVLRDAADLNRASELLKDFVNIDDGEYLDADAVWNLAGRLASA